MKAGGGEGDRDAHVREAFSLLADETRLDIVEYLRQAEEAASYAEIKNGIGVRDSGRFNYHLNELTGTFVTETDEGYELSFSAIALYQAVLSTRPLSEHPDLRLEPGESCPECGVNLQVGYENELVVSDCPDCDTQSFGYPFPAGGFEGRTDEEALRAAVQRMYHHLTLAERGVCPYCAGPMTTEWTSDHETPFSATVVAIHTCLLCEMVLHAGVVATVQRRTAVVSLFDDYGLRPREMLPREFREYVSVDDLEVRSEDPFRATVPIEIEGDGYLLYVEAGEESGVELDVEANG